MSLRSLQALLYSGPLAPARSDSSEGFGLRSGSREHRSSRLSGGGDWHALRSAWLVATIAMSIPSEQVTPLETKRFLGVGGGAIQMIFETLSQVARNLLTRNNRAVQTSTVRLTAPIVRLAICLRFRSDVANTKRTQLSNPPKSSPDAAAMRALAKR